MGEWAQMESKLSAAEGEEKGMFIHSALLPV